QGQPSHLFHPSVCNTDHRIITGEILASKNIAAFVEPFPAVASLVMPAVFKRKCLRPFPWEGQRKVFQIFPEIYVEQSIFSADTCLLKALPGNSRLLQHVQG